MQIQEENFPLYQMAVDSCHPLMGDLLDAFGKAVKGGDEDKYRFALTVQTLVLLPPPVPGQTEELIANTLQACLVVFEEAGSRGHAWAAFAAATARTAGYGCKQDLPQAKLWLDKAEDLGLRPDVVQQLREELQQKMKPHGFARIASIFKLK